jgi:putative intracellular protease/amidase
MIKKLAIGLGGVFFLLVATVAATWFWALKFSPTEEQLQQLRATQAQNIPYLQNTIPPARGKILAVVTSVRTLGNTGRPTGYELSELARAYWVFYANGFDVDIASPLGDEPYALLDDDDMGQYDYAFLNNSLAQQKTKNTLALKDVSPSDYVAVYFVGGKGAMFDFPDDPAVIALAQNFAAQQKVIAAVCHGPAALVNVKSANGQWLVTNKTVSGFTNNEELLLIPNATEIFPFLLQNKLEARGANFISGEDFLEQVSVSDNLITGQNPWSVWRLAEETVRQLGYEPVTRAKTAEENTVELLQIYQNHGLAAAEKYAQRSGHEYYGQLVLMHSLVAFMKWEIIDGLNLIILADGVRQG